MVSRLVLGCGSVGRSLARAVNEGPGVVLVLTPDEHRVETLRAENVPAERADPADPSVLAEYDPNTVIVGSDDPGQNRQAATLAAEYFPDAFRLAYAGKGATQDDVAALRGLADHVVDPVAAVADDVLGRVGDEGVHVRQLRRVLRSIDGTLAVVAHDNPDPDAIASALALAAVAERFGTPAQAVYFGDINHQENRALVNLLDLSLRNIDGEDLDEFGGFALVDHSRPGVNDQLPEDTPVDVVIDHHPPRAPIDAQFVDLRSDVGATSTLITDYLRALGIEPSTSLATGLLFGIRVDTKDFSREVSLEDFEAATYLLPFADTETLNRVESPSVSPETLDIVGRAIRNRVVNDGVLLTCVRDIGDRDALAQAADQLLDMEDVTTTLVYGHKDDTVYASARARGTDLDLGEALREAFGQIGSAGGHADMAGAQIPVGALVEEGEDEGAAIEEFVRERFFETLGIGPHRASPVYAGREYLRLPEGPRREAQPEEDVSAGDEVPEEGSEPDTEASPE
ncbi:DHH family phosphoesterase [Natronomonas sp. EA1]|uniref:DHH family phosphoesterase n=1 Tax=Natronomonas sp. EA1 TaxID=3421655 RepID=UPI003EBECDBD